MASLFLASRLKSVDFPTFGRPTTATIGRPTPPLPAGSARSGRALKCFVTRTPSRVPHVAHLRLRLVPLGRDAHPELQVHLPPHERLDARARGGADLLQHLAALADEDLLVPLAVDVDRKLDPGRPPL